MEIFLLSNSISDVPGTINGRHSRNLCGPALGFGASENPSSFMRNLKRGGDFVGGYPQGKTEEGVMYMFAYVVYIYICVYSR